MEPMDDDHEGQALADLRDLLDDLETAPPGSVLSMGLADRLTAAAQAALRAEVAEARRTGVSWAGVGGALGVSRQSAQERFGGR